MNKSKKSLAMLSTAAIAGLLVAAVSTPVSAKTTALAVTGKDTKTYEYNFATLKTSATAYILNNGVVDANSKLYADFLTRKSTIKAYYDDVKAAYVDATVVNAAAVAAATSVPKVTFVLDTFTSATTTATTPVTAGKVAVDANGNVTVDGVIVNPTPTTQLTVSSVSAINATDATETPLSGATISPDQKIKVVFSKPVDTSTVNLNTVKLYNGTALGVISNISFDTTKTVATITHTTLSNGTSCKLMLSSSISTADGATLPSTEIDFSTNSNFVVKSLTVGSATNVTNNSNLATITNIYASGSTKHILVNLNNSIDPTSVGLNTAKLQRTVKAGTAVTTPESIAVTSVLSGTTADASKVLDISVPDTSWASAGLQNDVIVLTVSGLTDINGNSLSTQTYQLVLNQSALTSTAIGPDGVSLSNTTYYYGKTTSTKSDGTVNFGFKSIIKFTQAVDPTTITSTNVKLQKLNTDGSYSDVAATLTLASDNKSVTIVPQSDLDKNATYRVLTTTNVKSAFGLNATGAINQSFTTTDSSNPSIVSVTPANGATDIDTTKEFDLTFAFDKAIDISTNDSTATPGVATAATFATGSTGSAANHEVTIYDATAGSYISTGCSIAYVDGSSNKSIKLVIPANTLTKAHTYTVTLAGKDGSQDSAKKLFADTFNNALASSNQVQFTTVGVDTTLPQVSKLTVGTVNTGTAVTTGSLNLDNTKAINIEFNKLLASAGTIKVEKYNPSTGVWADDTAIEATIAGLSLQSYKATYSYLIVPASTFATGEQYRITVSGSQDTVSPANTMADQYQTTLTFGNGPVMDTTNNVATATYASAAAATGATSITVNSATGLTAGKWIGVKADNGTYTISKITGVTGTTLTLGTGLTSAVSGTSANTVVKVTNIGAFGSNIAKDDAILLGIKAETANTDDRVDLSTISSSTVSLKGSDGSVVTTNVNAIQADLQTSGTLSDAVVTIVPTSNLTPGVTYTVAVNGVKDRLGNIATSANYSFAVKSESSQLQVASVTPADNASNVAVNSPITVTFNTALDKSVLGSANADGSYNLGTSSSDKVSLTTGGTPTYILGTYTVSTDKKTITISPKGFLTAGTIYSVQLAAALTSDNTVSADALGTAKTYNFQTEATASVTPKIASATYYDYGTAGVGAGDVILLKLNAPLGTAVTSFGTTNFTVSTGTTIATADVVSVSGDGETVAITLGTGDGLVPGVATISANTLVDGLSNSFSTTPVTITRGN